MTKRVAFGFKATDVARQLPGGPEKNQVHCGLTVPPLGSTAYTASDFMKLSLISATSANGGAGCSRPTRVPDSVTLYARPPAATATGPEIGRASCREECIEPCRS